MGGKEEENPQGQSALQREREREREQVYVMITRSVRSVPSAAMLRGSFPPNSVLLFAPNKSSNSKMSIQFFLL